MKFSSSRGWSLFLLSCLMLLAEVNPLKAQPESYLFETLAGSPKLALPQYDALAFDANDTLYFKSRGVIYRFSSALGISELAGPSRLWSVSVAGARFNGATALAVAGDGSVYVGDSLTTGEETKAVVRIVSPAGSISTLELAEDSEIKFIPGQLQNLALDRAGNLYGTVGYGQAVYRIDAGRHLQVLATEFETVGGMALDDEGNIYFADSGHSLILKMTPQGKVSTVVDGSTVTDEGLGLRNPSYLALDANNTLYITAFDQTAVFKVELGSTPKLSLYAGKPGVSAGQDGPLDTATFFGPQALAVDHQGLVHVIDWQPQLVGASIRRISDGAVTTLVGDSTNTGSLDGQGREARFDHPEGVAVDADRNVFVADTGNSTIRRITPAGAVSTLAGRAGMIGSDDGPGADARFAKPSGIAVDSHGVVYVADTGNHVIRRITPTGNVSTVAGVKGHAGYVDGTASQFSSPLGVAIGPDETVYVADTGNFVIRQIRADGQVRTVSESFTFSKVRGVTVLGNGLIFAVGASYHSLVGFQPTQRAGLNVFIFTSGTPSGLASDAAGNFFLTVTDSYYGDILGVYDSSAQALGGGNTGLNDGLGRNAEFQQPLGIAVDRQGNLYVADTGNSTIRRGNLTGRPSVLNTSRSTNVVAGNDCTFNATFGGTPPLTYQWLLNGIDLPGATNASLTFHGVGTNDSGSYDVRVANAFGSDVSVWPIGLTVVATLPRTDPKGPTTAFVGSPWRANANPTGAKPWSLQWFFNGQPLTGQTNEILSLDSVTPANGGIYTVALSNPYGSYTNNAPARLGISASLTTGAPASQKVFSGEDAVLMVHAPAPSLIRYQWQRDGTPLPDATNSALRLPHVSATDAGSYTVTLTSPYSFYTTKPAAVLTVLEGAPTIILQPSSQDVRAGGDVSFRVQARGGAPLTYQWRWNDQAIAGATNAALVLTGVNVAGAGRYAVSVSNDQGSKDSGVAILTVAPLAEVPGPQDQAVWFGDSAILEAPEVGFSVGSHVWSQSALGANANVTLFGRYESPLVTADVSLLMTGRLALRSWNGYAVRVADASGEGTNSGPAIVSAFPAAPALLPIGLTGWSHDVVLEDASISRIDTGFDGGPPYHSWIEAGVQSHADGLPPSRRLASAKDTNVLFELQPYAGPNALWMRASISTNLAGTLQLVRPARYSRLAFLAATTYGFGEGSPGTLVLEFADDTCSAALPLNCPDWWVNSSTNFLAFGGLTEAYPDRLSVTNNKVSLRFPDTQPAYGMGLYQTDVDLVALGLADRELSAITFQAPAQGQPTGIFAVSGREVENPGRPYFVSDPLSQRVQAGTRLELRSLAVGEQPIVYQWFKDDVFIPGVSGPVLTLNPVAAGDAARYSVVAKNAAGTAIGVPGVVEVQSPPGLGIGWGNGHLTLVWSDDAYVLERKRTLGSDSAWETVSTGIVVAGGQSSYTVVSLGDAYFFRLRQR